MQKLVVEWCWRFQTISIYTVAVILLLSINFPLQATGSPTQNARADLSSWSFEKQGPALLEQDWTVYRDIIVEPHLFQKNGCTIPVEFQSSEPEHVRPPDVWGPGWTTDVTTGHGKATYCLEIRMPDKDQFYALRMGAIRSVSAIYALFENEHGRPSVALLHKNGGFSADLATVNNPMPPLITLPFGITKFTLIAQIQNEIHKQGGMIEVPVIDLEWRLRARDNRETALPNALVIVLLVISLAAFVIGMRYERSNGHNIFAFLAFAAAMRVLFVSDIVWDYYPSFSLARKYDLEYLSMFLIAPAYYAFISYLFKQGNMRWGDYLMYGTSAVLIIVAVFIAPFLPAGTITLFREPIPVFWSIIVIIIIRTLFWAAVNNPRQYQEVVVVILAGLATLAYETLSVLGVIGASLEWSQALLLFVMLMHTRAFVRNSRRIQKERDNLTASLQAANDILQQRAVALDMALMKAEDASNAKSEFLTTISHELRTPLNAIIGFSELISGEMAGPIGNRKYSEYAGDINQSGIHLLELVEDILDLSRIETGTQDLSEEQLHLPTLVELVMRLLRPQANEMHVTCAMEINQDLPWLWADERKVKQILINLVGNAIKFNRPNGTVTIGAHTSECGFCIEVKDTGIGIEPDDIALVLTRFGQVDSDLSRKYAGVGIGLPLATAIMKQHGGDLKIQSEPNVGTTVIVCFPVERCR